MHKFIRINRAAHYRTACESKNSSLNSHWTGEINHSTTEKDVGNKLLNEKTLWGNVTTSVRTKSSLVFLDYISPFNICCKVGLVVLNSLNFCLSVKLFISLSILSEILSEYSNLGCRFFSFSTLNISCHSLLACRVSAERSAVKCMGFPCMLLVASPFLLLIVFVF